MEVDRGDVAGGPVFVGMEGLDGVGFVVLQGGF
jgi:hypothetical protein